ncbi:F-box only protein 36 isoform X2 [Rhincodon typus]|uniref:F-box only protein 36 isoform X2 n=1 Tax=Rhincodon typus TaxID=259920 RepID=UPI0009A29D78|nr:F-box only protein 36 isoform X2 [Rhincodon typus]
MASLLKGTLYEIRAQAPAPSKDYHQLLVTDSEVIWRWWKISLRREFRNVHPGEQINSHQDFLENYMLQVHIDVIFGNEVLKYICNLCQHHFDYLDRIPNGLLMYIILFLDLEDIARLSQTSRKFEKVCNSEELWERLVLRHCDTITPETRALASEVGWKEIFFTNKLQLQKKIRRRREKFGRIAENLPLTP